ncbi:hypothetical protein ACWDTP_34235 [Mycobacterium sp. NPDC003449]
MANNVDDIARKWADKFPPAPPAEPVVAEPVEEPAVSDHHIPNAGNQPDVSDEVLAALAAQGQGPETFDQKNQRLAKMLQPQTLWN